MSHKFISLLSCLLLAVIGGCGHEYAQNGIQSHETLNVAKTNTVSESRVRPRESHDAPTTRSFEFKYGATIVGVPAQAKVRVWFPIATTNAQQSIELTGKQSPSRLDIQLEKKHGNKIGFFEYQPGQTQDVDFELTYDVVREQAAVDDSQRRLGKKDSELYVAANTLVPIDGQPIALIPDADFPLDPLEAGQTIYNIVEQHMTYDKSQPGYGNGDSIWACNSKTGNCTDFHSLFISLARSQALPARFEIGFPIPSDKRSGSIGGYHCWAWFHVRDQGWVPVDISEADKHPELKEFYFGKLTPDRIAFSSGRDIQLIPPSQSGPRNYFVYPHVEVDGKEWPQDKIKLNFSFLEKNQPRSAP